MSTHADESLDQHRENLRRIATARRSEPAAALAALRAGVPQVEIARELGRTREHVRRITKDAALAE